MKRKDFEIVRGDSTTFSWELEGDKRNTNFLFGIKKSNNISDARLISKTTFTKTYNPTTNTTLIVTTISGNETHDLQYKTLYYDLVNVDEDSTEFTGKISNVFDIISDLDGLNVIDETNRALIIRAKEFQDGQYIKVKKVGDVFDYQGTYDIPGMLSLDENGDLTLNDENNYDNNLILDENGDITFLE